MIDVISNVIVGEPIAVATGLWRVPYDVVDDAGNRGETVFRHVNDQLLRSTPTVHT